MRWSAGTKHSPENDNRQSNSPQPSYTLYQDGATIRAEANFPGLSDQSGTAFHTVMNDAINALTAGAEILVKGQTTYNVTGTIIPKSKIHIFGEGPSTVLKLGPNVNAEMFYIQGSYAEAAAPVYDVRISNMQLDGNKANNTDGGPISARNSRRGMFDNLYIHDFISGNYVWCFSKYNAFDNCYIEDIGEAVVSGRTGITISDDGPGASVDNRITNCTIRGIKEHGITVYPTCNRTIIDNVNIYNAQNGIRIYGADGCQVSNIVIDTVSTYGIYLFSATPSTYVRRNNISNCYIKAAAVGVVVDGISTSNLALENALSNITIESPTDFGVWLNYGVDNVLTNIRVYNSAGQGFYIYDVDDTDIVNPVVVDPCQSSDLFGIYVLDGNNIQIKGGQLYNNQIANGCGICFTGVTGGLISNLTTRGHVSYGIRLIPSGATMTQHIRITGVRATGNASGLICEGAQYLEIVGNSFSDNTTYGIGLLDSGTDYNLYHAITGNTCEGNTHGIKSASNNTDKCVTIGNVARNNSTTQIGMGTGAGNITDHNIIT